MKHRAKPKTRIQNYNLYGDEDTALLPDFVHCERIASRSKAYDWAIKPHVHTQLYQIFLIETGEGHLLLDKAETPFAAPCIVAMPANHLHGFRYATPSDGRVITLSESYLETLFDASPQVVLTLNQVRLIPIETEMERFQSLIRLVDSIERELYEGFSEKKIALQAYLSLLLVELFRFLQQTEQAFLTNNNLQLQHFQNFQRQVRKAHSAVKTVGKYAKALNITTVHLNRICQAVAQKSASQWVEAYIISEAQKYLAHTSYTVAEISYLLDFNDPAYFSRLFKKQTQMSPKVFRNSLK